MGVLIYLVFMLFCVLCISKLPASDKRQRYVMLTVLLLFLVGTVFGISKVVGVCKSWSNTVNFKTTLASVSQTLQKDSGMKMSSSTASCFAI